MRMIIAATYGRFGSSTVTDFFPWDYS